MTINRYKLSFTTGSLFYQEAIKAAALYYSSKDWSVVRRGMIINNAFQSRTTASSERNLRELLPRLMTLSDEQLDILLYGNREEQNQILWLSVCKQYDFIKEFAIEVIREKVYRLDFSLCYADFDGFINSKSEWHEELVNLTIRTQKELRRVLFQMLREADILSKSSTIKRIIPSPRVARAIKSTDAELSAIFPLTETDFNRQVAL